MSLILIDELSQLLPKFCTICVPFPKIGYQTCEYMKLPGMVSVNEFFSIERMKNKSLLIFLFTVVLCTAIIVLAKEDLNDTEVSSTKLQHSSVESSQNDLPKVLRVLQFPTTVTDQVTEKISVILRLFPFPANFRCCIDLPFHSSVLLS